MGEWKWSLANTICRAQGAYLNSIQSRSASSLANILENRSMRTKMVSDTIKDLILVRHFQSLPTIMYKTMSVQRIVPPPPPKQLLTQAICMSGISSIFSFSQNFLG